MTLHEFWFYNFFIFFVIILYIYFDIIFNTCELNPKPISKLELKIYLFFKIYIINIIIASLIIKYFYN